MHSKNQWKGTWLKVPYVFGGGVCVWRRVVVVVLFSDWIMNYKANYYNVGLVTGTVRPVDNNNACDKSEIQRPDYYILYISSQVPAESEKIECQLFCRLDYILL